MRISKLRRAASSLASLTVAFSALASPAWAGWETAGGALVLPVGSPQLAVSDGSGGAFVVAVTPTARILVQHLTAAGEVAPSWPATGAVACTTAVLQGICFDIGVKVLSATLDGEGGIYVAFGATPAPSPPGVPTAYLQHLDAAGVRVPGWPASGAPVSLGPGGQTSLVTFPDGEGGAFVLWQETRQLVATANAPHLVIQRFHADGTKAPEYPAEGRILGELPGPASRDVIVFAVDPTGGAWAISRRASSDTTQSPAGHDVIRIDPATGQVAEGWGEDGVLLPGPSADVVLPGSYFPRVFPDGNGGAWSFVASGARGAVIAFHQLPDGGFDPALPPEGLRLAASPDQTVDPDGAGGFYVGTSSGPPAVHSLRHLLSDGTPDPAWTSPVEISGGRHVRLFPTGDGVFASGWADVFSPHCTLYAADVVIGWLGPGGSVPAGWPVGQTKPLYDFPAALDVSTAGWESDGVSCSDGSGGFIVFWRVMASYPPLAENEVRAMRYTLNGPVADVTPGSGGALALRGARFTRAGIRVRVATTAASGGRLSVHDLLGRRVAACEVPDGTGARELTIPGTSGLASGLYFLRLRTPAGDAGARVVVAH